MLWAARTVPTNGREPTSRSRDRAVDSGYRDTRRPGHARLHPWGEDGSGERSSTSSDSAPRRSRALRPALVRDRGLGRRRRSRAPALRGPALDASHRRGGRARPPKRRLLRAVPDARASASPTHSRGRSAARPTRRDGCRGGSASHGRPTRLRARPAPMPRGRSADVRVVDFGVGGVGPFAATLLALARRRRRQGRGAERVHPDRASDRRRASAAPTSRSTRASDRCGSISRTSGRLRSRTRARRRRGRRVENFRPGALGPARASASTSVLAFNPRARLLLGDRLRLGRPARRRTLHRPAHAGVQRVRGRTRTRPECQGASATTASSTSSPRRIAEAVCAALVAAARGRRRAVETSMLHAAVAAQLGVPAVALRGAASRPATARSRSPAARRPNGQRSATRWASLAARTPRGTRFATYAAGARTPRGGTRLATYPAALGRRRRGLLAAQLWRPRPPAGLGGNCFARQGIPCARAPSPY